MGGGQVGNEDFLKSLVEQYSNKKVSLNYPNGIDSYNIKTVLYGTLLFSNNGGYFIESSDNKSWVSISTQNIKEIKKDNNNINYYVYYNDGTIALLVFDK